MLIFFKLILTRRFLNVSLYLHRKLVSSPGGHVFQPIKNIWTFLAVRRPFMPSHFQILQLVFLKMPWVCLQFVIVVFPNHTDKKTCSKFSYTLIGKTVLPPWRPGFFINLYNMNNLGQESAKDHLCRTIFKSDQ